MQFKKSKTLFAALLGALGSAVCLPVHADRAVVVGVNLYPSLGDHDLRGCVNDANTMAAALKRYHFEVTLLTDKKATYQGILDALSAVQSEIKPDERLVFYFAGHGTPAAQGGASLLPSDTLPDSLANDIQADDLNKLLRAIPAKSRTVLLDTCFSGGMLRSRHKIDRPASYRSRLYVRDVAIDTPPDAAAAATASGAITSPVPLLSQSKVCYFTASRMNEEAGEVEFGGHTDGIFTHYLVTHLSGKSVPWGTLASHVSAEVSAYMADRQHPDLSPGFSSVSLFDPEPTKSVVSNP